MAMLTRVLVKLCEVSPQLRRALWRWWYNKLARQINAEQWIFMNYGCQLPTGAGPLQLNAADEPDRLCIQLYERVIGNLNLTGAKVLEVGSGRGGGSSYIARYRRPRSILGIDFSREAVAFSRLRHCGIPNLEFEVGDAESLKVPGDAFDAVINVESSHCYGNVPRFVAEIARVLRLGGHFLFADLREPAEMEAVRDLLKMTDGFVIVEEEDITNSVIAALELDDARKREMIQALVPSGIQPLFNEFAGIRGGQVFEGLQNGTLVYHRFCIRKERSQTETDA